MAFLGDAGWKQAEGRRRLYGRNRSKSRMRTALDIHSGLGVLKRFNPRVDEFFSARTALSAFPLNPFRALITRPCVNTLVCDI